MICDELKLCKDIAAIVNKQRVPRKKCTESNRSFQIFT